MNARPWWLEVLFAFSCVVTAVLIIASLAGCAEDRWLTKEEDAEMRATCEPVGGCAVIPNPVWKQIERALGLVGA